MVVLVTGAAGFIGFHVANVLLKSGRAVIGVDDLNPYYDVSLKQARLDQLQSDRGFRFEKADVSDRDAIFSIFSRHPDIEGIVHLAAQAGVRHSLINPYVYVTSNVMGQVVMLEAARTLARLKHFVYASSSSVYGGNTKLPFSIDDPVVEPQSLYAATKRADELISSTYAHLYGVPSTGLRFFTVYGPWGRPDMAAFIFTRAILAEEPIKVFNHGEMWRDFTFIDDIVQGVLRALDKPATGEPPHKVYNLGNHQSEKLTDFIGHIERALGKRAVVELEPMQMGDVPSTYADIEASRRELGFEPRTSVVEGIPVFIDWYRRYHRV